MSKKVILWAIDPESLSPEFYESGAEFIKTISSRTSTRLIPVSLICSDSIETAYQFDLGKLKKVKKEQTERVKAFVNTFGLRDVADPHVLIDLAPNQQNPYELLTTHADEIGADMILVNSHGRSDISRILFGSFSEKLFRYTNVPVVVLTPKTGNFNQLREILFVTDLTEASRNSFDRVVPICRALGLSLSIFNLDNGSDAACSEKMRRARDWKRASDELGVETKICITCDEPEHDVESAVVRLARENASEMIVAISTHGSRWNPESGKESVARQIVRNSCCPVWVLPLAG